MTIRAVTTGAADSSGMTARDTRTPQVTPAGSLVGPPRGVDGSAREPMRCPECDGPKPARIGIVCAACEARIATDPDAAGARGEGE